MRRLTMLALATLLSACGERTPEQQLADYNKKLGSQGELTATHLIIRWPSRDHGGGEPVTLKVPREYLDKVPVAKDETGLFKLYINFALPGVKPWAPMPLALKDDPPERVKQIKDHERSRVLVIVGRDGVDGRGPRENMRLEVFWFSNSPTPGLRDGRSLG